MNAREETHGSDFIRAIARRLKSVQPSLRLAVLFGSAARGQTRFDSDVDLGVLDRRPLDSDVRFELAQAVGDETGMPGDIVDLYWAPTPITHIALRGTRLFGSDEHFAALCTRSVIEQEDFGRLRERLIDRRLAAWTR